MPLACGSCGAAMEREALDLARRTALCRACGRFHDILAGGPGPGGRRRASLRPLPEFPPPPGFRVVAKGPLRIERRWLLAAGRENRTAADAAAAALGALAGGVFLLGLLWWGLGAWMEGVGLPAWARWTAAAAGMAAWALAFLALLFNSTRFEVGGGRLTVRHGPVPWGGNRDLEAGAVTRLFTVSRLHRPERRAGEGMTITFEVWAGLPGRAVRLDTFVRRVDALFVEQTLRGRLGLGEDPAPGGARGDVPPAAGTERGGG